MDRVSSGLVIHAENSWPCVDAFCLVIRLSKDLVVPVTKSIAVIAHLPFPWNWSVLA